MTLCLKYEIGLEDRLIDSRNVYLVNSSYAVAAKLEGHLTPGAGRALAVGGSGLSVEAEADGTLDLAAFKFGVKQDLFTFTAGDEDKGGA